MSEQEFIEDVLTQADSEKRRNHPLWRQGQAVYNYLYKLYPNEVKYTQIGYGVDCYYNDDDIIRFIKITYAILEDNGTI